MGILDQLFDFNLEEDDETISVSPADVINISTAQAAHQAMQDSFRAVDVANTITPKLSLGTNGTVSVARSLKLSFDYQQNLVADQLAAPGDRPTANDVIDGGIKRGQKVVFEVSSNRSINSGSWDEVVKQRMLSDVDQPIGLFFDKFSVMNISEPDSERYQIHETFGAEIIQTFGRRPRLITMSGQVLNGRVDAIRSGVVRSMDWKNAFQRFYDDHFSLKACLRKKHKVRITAQDTIWHGYLLNMVAITDAENQAISQVTVTFIVSSRNFRNKNDLAIPGFLNENGFRITGGIVPDEFFPQERLEFYFKEDFSQVVKTRVSNLNSEIEDLKSELEIAAGLTRRDLDLNIEDDGQFVIDPIQGLAVDPYLNESEFVNDAINLAREIVRLNIDSQTYASNIGAEYSDEIPLSNNSEYLELKEREASLRIREKNLASDLAELNTLCRNLRQKILELDSYTQIQAS